jgi:protein arginine N-methyltransferase 6
VEASGIADQARRIVAENHMEDKIKVIKQKMENVILPEKVDVIISEWMGYFLIYESMLDSVLFARDRWLKQGGTVFPSRARMYMAPICDDETWAEKIDFWRNVYGVNMTSMIPHAVKCAFEEPMVETVPSNMQIGQGVCFAC